MFWKMISTIIVGKKILRPFILTMLLLFSLGVPITLFSQIAVDTIIERTLRALGGRERIDEIEVMYREGELTIGMPVEGIDNINQRKIRSWWIPFKGTKTEIEDDKSIVGSVFTAKAAHRYNVSLPSNDVIQFENVPAYELNTMMRMFNKLSFIPSLCINTYNNERNTQMKGYEHIGDKRCFKLVYKGQHTIYVEEKTYLPLKFLQTFYDDKNRTESFVEYYFSEYKRTNMGLILPTIIEQTRKGNDIPIVYHYTTNRVNGDLARDDNEVFSVTEIQKQHDEYVEKMGKVYKEEKRRSRPSSSRGVPIKIAEDTTTMDRATEKAEKDKKMEKVKKVEKDEKAEKAKKVEKDKKMEKVKRVEKDEKAEKVEKDKKAEKLEKKRKKK